MNANISTVICAFIFHIIVIILTTQNSLQCTIEMFIYKRNACPALPKNLKHGKMNHVFLQY